MRELTQTCRFRLAEWGELEEDDRELLVAAIQARDRARAGQSHFKVGAAIRSSDGATFLGCNIEDVGYSGTIHAEEAVLSVMVAASNGDANCVAVAVALGPEGVDVGCPPHRDGTNIASIAEIINTPCGHCRAMLSQYGPKGGDIKVLAIQPNGEVLFTTMADLYPAGFSF